MGKMKKTALAILAALYAVAAAAQTGITFDSDDYAAIGVYDTWEQSPFRLGTPRLKGDVEVTANRFKADTAGVDNTSPNVLALRRSRFGSNTFGARIWLKHPLPTSEEAQYLHALVRKPNTTKVMLVGLGKRESFAEEPDSIEQFWVVAEQTPVAGQWCDMVFPMRTVSGVRLYSLVIVPDLASPHKLADDFTCHIDEIEVNSDPRPRTRAKAGAGIPYYVEIRQDTAKSDGTGSPRSLWFWSGGERVSGIDLRVAGSNAATPYANATGPTDTRVSLKPGEEYRAVYTCSGGGITRAAMYVDYNNDGQFDPRSETLCSTAKPGEFPTLTIPASTRPGIYRLRLKYGGGEIADAYSIRHGEGMLDILLNIHADTVGVNARAFNGNIRNTKGESTFRAPFGQELKLKVVPAPGFRRGSVVVRHGYNLDGPQYAGGNAQWHETALPPGKISADGTLILPRSCVDGDISIVGTFIQKR